MNRNKIKFEHVRVKIHKLNYASLNFSHSMDSYESCKDPCRYLMKNKSQ